MSVLLAILAVLWLAGGLSLVALGSTSDSYPANMIGGCIGICMLALGLIFLTLAIG